MAIVHQSSVSSSGTGTSATINKPAGTVSGDVLVALLFHGAAPTAPAGWTTYLPPSSSGANDGVLYVKVAGGSEPASYTWTQASSATWKGGISRFSGVDNVAPLDVAPDIVGAGGAPTVGPVTTVTANAMVVAAAASQNTPTWTPPAGMTERWDANGVTLDTVLQAVAGSTGTKAWTSTGSNSFSEGFLTALREAGAVLNVVFGAGIASAEVVGQPAVSGVGNAPVTFGSGIPSAEAVGQPTISQVSSGTQSVVFSTGIPSAETVGQPTLTMGSTILSVRVRHEGATQVKVRDYPIGA